MSSKRWAALSGSLSFFTSSPILPNCIGWSVCASVCGRGPRYHLKELFLSNAISLLPTYIKDALHIRSCYMPLQLRDPKGARLFILRRKECPNTLSDRGGLKCDLSKQDTSKYDRGND